VRNVLLKLRNLFDPEFGAHDRLIPRWLFLRALGLIYISAFLPLVFQITGLIGPDGVLPANQYLQAVARAMPGLERFWFAPSLLWISASSHALTLLVWVGLLASALATLNLWPRLTLFVCFACFLSFVAAAGDFSGYQSDSMLLEAGFISLFFAPSGIRPGLGADSPPSRMSMFLLIWEWFRIYFESGAVKLLSHDPQWRDLTAMDQYYQNGPLPTWIGWYVQHLPHWFHWATAAGTLAMELGIVWLGLLPRRYRILCFFIVTPWQIGVILTANYTFLTYRVLVLGFLLLDDGFIARALPWTRKFLPPPATASATQDHEAAARPVPSHPGSFFHHHFHAAGLAVSVVLLTWVLYATTVQLFWMFVLLPLPTSPVAALDPFRVANRYGLFAVMTRGRYEIEFQGSDDGEHWLAYSFRFKPQALNERPGIYAPYQPRFDWNLWFASLGSWRDNSIVPSTEERLLNNAPDVLGLFRSNPFPQHPPKQIRVVLWQYWFTSMDEKRKTGDWWRREYLGFYAPTLEREPDGSIQPIARPDVPPRD
jgi:hypothetical protein